MEFIGGVEIKNYNRFGYVNVWNCLWFDWNQCNDTMVKLKNYELHDCNGICIL